MKRWHASVWIALFGVVACSSDDGGGGSSSDPYDKARQLCVDKTNAYRAQTGVAAVARATDKEACTDGEAKSDFASGKPHGAFGTCKESAQNECPHWSGTPEDVVTNCLAMMYAEGPGEPYSEHGHYINMTSAKYSRVSCGFYVENGAVQMVQNFY
ncbi:MAG: hypothetical protein HY898_01055 [Deltaproteobacteria bacterium]|nr:hypothetical protein [Deltaproteobacteria bacterium]